MNKSILLLAIVIAGSASCKQGSKSTKPESVQPETINSVRNYEYTDSSGNRLIINNSLPKSRLNYTDPTGKKYVYAVFWTQLINQTNQAVELKMEFPKDSFEFPRASGNYLKILIPPDTMTTAKAALPEYGLDPTSFLDTGIIKASSLIRTIHPKDSTAFYVVTISGGGAGGALRTGLSVNGGSLVYKLSLFKNDTPELALMDTREINCGIISVRKLVLKK